MALCREDVATARTASLKGKRLPAYVYRIYDGDTLSIITRPDFEEGGDAGDVFKFNLRLAGVDTPELRSKYPPAKKHAYEARDYVRALCLDTVVTITGQGTDKYGRELASVTTAGGEELSELLLRECFALAYEGKKRETDEEVWDGLVAARQEYLGAMN